MTAVYLFAGLLLILVVVGLVASPLLEGEPVDEEDATAADRRDAEIETLRQVEFEYRTGKLSEEDYRELRERHAEAAVRARREAEGEAVDAEEARAAGAPRASGPTDASEDSGRAEAEDAGEADRSRCPDCGAEARAGARFCSRCGAALEAPGAEPEDTGSETEDSGSEARGGDG